MIENFKRGLYIVFEGPDGVGKTTTMHLVAIKLRGILKQIIEKCDVIETHHPGSTPLGKHIRQLLKYPEQISQHIEIDDLSRQILYFVDTISFFRTILKPALSFKNIVFADRSTYISGLVFGCADGISINEISKLYDIVIPPKIDRLYIMRCPTEVTNNRLLSDKNRVMDRYDKLGSEFQNKVRNIYDNLVTGPIERTMFISRCVALENIVYVDTTASQNDVVNFIVDDMIALISEREKLSISSFE